MDTLTLLRKERMNLEAAARAADRVAEFARDAATRAASDYATASRIADDVCDAAARGNDIYGEIDDAAAIAEDDVKYAAAAARAAEHCAEAAEDAAARAADEANAAAIAEDDWAAVSGAQEESNEKG